MSNAVHAVTDLSGANLTTSAVLLLGLLGHSSTATRTNNAHDGSVGGL